MRIKTQNLLIAFKQNDLIAFVISTWVQGTSIRRELGLVHNDERLKQVLQMKRLKDVWIHLHCKVVEDIGSTGKELEGLLIDCSTNHRHHSNLLDGINFQRELGEIISANILTNHEVQILTAIQIQRVQRVGCNGYFGMHFCGFGFFLYVHIGIQILLMEACNTKIINNEVGLRDQNFPQSCN